MFDYHWKPLFSASNQQLTNRTWTVHFTFDRDLTEIIVNSALAIRRSLRDLLLTCYFVFLFKLILNETDLCVGLYIGDRSESLL